MSRGPQVVRGPWAGTPCFNASGNFRGVKAYSPGYGFTRIRNIDTK